MKRLNLYLSWLLVLKRLNFELPFKFVIIMLWMVFVTSSNMKKIYIFSFKLKRIYYHLNWLLVLIRVFLEIKWVWKILNFGIT